MYNNIILSANNKRLLKRRAVKLLCLRQSILYLCRKLTQNLIFTYNFVASTFESNTMFFMVRPQIALLIFNEL